MHYRSCTCPKPATLYQSIILYKSRLKAPRVTKAMFCCVFFTPSMLLITSTLWILAWADSPLLFISTISTVTTPRRLSLQHGRCSLNTRKRTTLTCSCWLRVFVLTWDGAGELFFRDVCVFGPRILFTRQKAGVCLHVLSLTDHLIIGTLVACCRCLLFTLLHCNQTYPEWQVGMLLKWWKCNGLSLWILLFFFIFLVLHYGSLVIFFFPLQNWSCLWPA